MADMFLDSVIDYEDYVTDYLMGNLSEIDAYEYGILDEHGYLPTHGIKMAKKKTRRRKTATPKPPPQTTARRLHIPGPTEKTVVSENLHDYAILFMGDKGWGKSTTASGFDGNLSFMWEPRRKNLSLREIGAKDGLIFKTAQEIMDDPNCDPWPLFKDYVYTAIDDSTVETITYDSVDIAYQACFESICARLGVTHPKQIKDDYGNSWNVIKNEFSQLIDRIRGSDSTGVVFLTHTKEREREVEGEVLEILSPSCSPACMQILKACCSFWFYGGWDDGKRYVQVRDPERLVEVAAGCGFVDSDGVDIERIYIPKLNNSEIQKHPDQIYKILCNNFKGQSTPRVTKKKGTKKKASKKR